jgi:hypothetical protein
MSAWGKFKAFLSRQDWSVLPSPSCIQYDTQVGKIEQLTVTTPAKKRTKKAQVASKRPKTAKRSGQ